MIVQKNYYEILGVTPDDNAVEIKTAYRKLARKYHPDLNGSNPNSIKMFKDVSEAYETLSDEQKRKQYDLLNGFFKSAKTKTDPKQAEKLYQESPFVSETKKKKEDSKSNAKQAEPVKEKNTKKEEDKKDEKHFSNVVNDIFEEFTKQSKQKHEKEQKEKLQPKKGADIYTDISVNLEEVMQGTSRTVNIMHTQQCPNCKGRKFINGSSCKNCSGKGEIISHKKITVKIPKNVKNGSKLRVALEGNEGTNGGKNGDLYLIIKIEGCSKIKYEGANILYSLPISPQEAVLGGEIAVPTFDGNIMLKLPPRTHSGQKFRLTGQGLSQSGKSGDMIVTVHIEIPSSLSEDEIRLYEKLRKLSNSDIRENILND